MQLQWAGHAPGKPGVGVGAHCKGPGRVTELALLSLSTRSPHTFNSTEETCNVCCCPLAWGAAPYNTRWMRSAAGAPSPGDWHTYWFHVAGTTPSVVPLCKGRRRGLVQESNLISGRSTTSAYLMQLCSSCKGWRGRDMGRAPEVHTDTRSCGCHLISVSHR